jgi:hypothetical protein
MSGEILYTVSPTGETTRYPAPPELWNTPLVAPSGMRWVFFDNEYLMVGEVSGEIITLMRGNRTHSPVWSPDSQTLLFFAKYGDAYALYAAYAPDFTPILVQDEFTYPDSFVPPVLVSP